MNWFNELIGFLIVLFALLFPLIQKLLLKKSQKKQAPPPISRDHEDEEAPFTGRLPERYTTQRIVGQNFEFHPALEERVLDTSIEKRSFETKIAPHFKESVLSQAFMAGAMRHLEKEKPNPLIHILLKKDPLQSMVIASEVFGPPKGLQDDNTR